MIKQILNWLRRDDQMLEPLRKQIKQKEQEMDWNKLQGIIIYILFAVSLMGLAFMFTMLWIA